MYEGEDVNTIDLLYEIETTERNGVKVIVPVKYQDQYQFRKKIKEQHNIAKSKRKHSIKQPTKQVQK